MKKVLIFIILLSSNIYSAQDITGLWMSLSDETNLPRSVALIYKYEDKIYGRIIVTYDYEGNINDSITHPVKRAEKIKGDPYYAGLDFIWELKDKGKRWAQGKILDPEKGHIYSCDMWLNGNNLIVRGKIGFLGRNQTWLPVKIADLPEDLILPDSITPRIPAVK